MRYLIIWACESDARRTKIGNRREEKMAEYTDAIGIEELQDGQMKGVELGGKKLLVARSGGQFYAASDVCPHMKARLSAGSLKGTTVTCPRHGSQFDLKDGRVVRWTDWSGMKLSLSKLFRGPRALPTYRTQIEGERLKVEL